MEEGKKRYRVKQSFDATRVGELDQCSSVSGAETKDTTIHENTLVWAYPEEDGFVRFMTPTALSTFCVRSSVFSKSTERDLLK